MTEPPWWLTIDLAVIVVSAITIGIGLWVGVAVIRRLPDWLGLIFLLLAIIAMVVVTGVLLEAVRAL